MKANYESEYGVNQCHGVTKDPSKNNYLLVFLYNELNSKIDELINRLLDSLNELINKCYSKTANLLSEFIETLKTIEDCTNCKDNMGKFNLDECHKLINKIESCLAKLEKVKEEWEKRMLIHYLNKKLFEIDNELNRWALCESCKEEVKKLTDKYGNKEIARFLHECKLNEECYHSKYIRWIPFNEFRNIEYLAKGGFGEVHKAIWINGYYNKYEEEYEDREVVLKRIYNSSDKIVDTLNEVK